ncbi:MAG: HEAT repeat domain-containing protein [Elusimicrobiota bacterium]
MLRLFFFAPLLWAQDPFPGGMPATSTEELPALERTLKDGEWNARIHAVHGLGAMGESAIPSLRLALQDADWQVRFTATHWLGRIGPGAVPALREVLREEPCRIIRITAVHWLGSLGDIMDPAASDNSPTVRMSRWYWLRKQGALPKDEQPPDASYEDTNLCLDSPYSGIPDVRPQTRTQPQKDSAERMRELDRLLEPERLERPSGVPQRETLEVRAPAELLQGRGTPLPEERKQPLEGPPEPRLPRPEGPGPRTDEPVLADAGLAEDHGQKPSHDPMPELLKALRQGAEKLRCRAADELGKMGPSAAEAVPELLLAAEDRSARLRANAALALGNIGKPAEKAVPALIRLLKDPDADVRYSAAHALARIGTPKAKKAFDRYLKRELRRSVR